MELLKRILKKPILLAFKLGKWIGPGLHPGDHNEVSDFLKTADSVTAKKHSFNNASAFLPKEITTEVGKKREEVLEVKTTRLYFETLCNYYKKKGVFLRKSGSYAWATVESFAQFLDIDLYPEAYKNEYVYVPINRSIGKERLAKLFPMDVSFADTTMDTFHYTNDTPVCLIEEDHYSIVPKSLAELGEMEHIDLQNAYRFGYRNFNV